MLAPTVLPEVGIEIVGGDVPDAPTNNNKAEVSLRYLGFFLYSI